MRVAAAVLFAVSSALTITCGNAAADPSVVVPDGYRLDDYRAPVPDRLPGGEVLHLAAMRDALAHHAALLVDVLPAPRRPEGMRGTSPWLPPRHASLPGSLWWPEIGRGAIPAAMDARMRQRLDEITTGDHGRLVVFFCLADCWMSWNAARRAASMGFHAGWFPEGVDGWRAAGLPTEDVLPEAIE